MKKILVLIIFAQGTLCVSAQQKKAVKAAPKPYAIGNKTVAVYTTEKGSDLRLAKTATLTFKDFPQPLETQPCIIVDPTKTFQTIVGIGGALTDAAAETFFKLPKEAQQELITAYYDPEKGIGYTLGRTNINSCDFSSDNYTYVADNDVALKTFNIAHDEKYKIPLIKQAMAAANGKLSLFVSPWSPPAWMKTNNDMLHGGKLKNEFKQSWANYYVKFINAYQKAGVPIWGLTLQNEPLATQRWESCVYTAEDERDFVKTYLGPTLVKGGLAGKKLIVWDHNRDLVYQQASTILEDPEAAKYIWGTGYHWYETWTGSKMLFENVKRVADSFPDKHLIFTEGCIESFKFNNLADWALGEKYGYSMINDFNVGTSGWTDWNILLDETGGPNHVGNFCYAPIIGDTRTGKLTYTNEYYYLGHFSKFIRPGAKRIAITASRDVLQATAFINTDGKIAVVVLNTTDQKLDYRLWIQGKAAETESLPHSIATLVIN